MASWSERTIQNWSSSEVGALNESLTSSSFIIILNHLDYAYHLVGDPWNRLRKLNSTPCVSPVGGHNHCHLLMVIMIMLMTMMVTMMMSMWMRMRMVTMMRVRMTTLLSSPEERLFNLPLSMFNWPCAVHGFAIQTLPQHFVLSWYSCFSYEKPKESFCTVHFPVSHLNSADIWQRTHTHTQLRCYRNSPTILPRPN